MCWLKISGESEQVGCVVGVWGGQNVWEAEVFGDDAVSDLTETKNSWVKKLTDTLVATAL